MVRFCAFSKANPQAGGKSFAAQTWRATMDRLDPEVAKVPPHPGVPLPTTHTLTLTHTPSHSYPQVQF